MDLNSFENYCHIRKITEDLCRSLEIEDYVIQSCEDVSPPKWHLAHTSWFFETFILIPYLKNYPVFHDKFTQLFNSYYQTVNDPYPRSRRGILSRPTVKKVLDYRHHIDRYMEELFDSLNTNLHYRIQLGLHHEQQHQELLLMDIKHNFFEDKQFPVYKKRCESSEEKIFFSADNYYSYDEGGIIEIGHISDAFCYDNEKPSHKYYLRPFNIANTLVTNAFYLEFMEAGGYSIPSYWLAEGWDFVRKHKWEAPLYWQKIDNQWYLFTLSGLHKLNLDEPVVHVSFYEADAFARWAKKRLPTEAEWEHFVVKNNIKIMGGHFLESNIFHPTASLLKRSEPQQFFGDVWEWTASPYISYPGFKAEKGALGEYNGKFMSNQFVLRGGSCLSPESHIRATYRNFFQPEKRWAFTGIRLADDA